MARHVMACTALATVVAAGVLVAPAAFAAPGGGTTGAVHTPRKAAAAKPGDVDRDGFGDLAVGAPEGTVKGHAKAGYVSLVYGTAQGYGSAGTRASLRTRPGYRAYRRPGTGSARRWPWVTWTATGTPTW